MRELAKARSIEARGPERRTALNGFKKQLRLWGITMPSTPPLVLDFGLGEFARTGLVECWIANEITAGYCGKYLFVFGGQTCPLHAHRTKHETFFVVAGRVRMRHGATCRTMKPGDVLPVRPGTKHSFTGVGPALLLELSKPCIVSDNFFADSRIPIGGNYKK